MQTPVRTRRLGTHMPFASERRARQRFVRVRREEKLIQRFREARSEGEEDRTLVGLGGNGLVTRNYMSFAALGSQSMSMNSSYSIAVYHTIGSGRTVRLYAGGQCSGSSTACLSVVNEATHSYTWHPYPMFPSRLKVMM